MKVTLTKNEMLRRRRMAAGLEPLRADCSIEQTDGIETENLLENELRKSYLDMLDHGPDELLASEDISAEATCAFTAAGASRCVAVTIPAKCRRVLELRLHGWQRAVGIEPPERASAIMQRQLNPFTAATAANPVAVLHSGSREILAWPAEGIAPRATLLSAYCDPGPDSYVLDEAGVFFLAGQPLTELPF